MKRNETRPLAYSVGLRDLLRLLAQSALVVTLASCSLSNLIEVKDPSDILPPGAVKSDAAAHALYRGAVRSFVKSVGQNDGVMMITGLMSDELLIKQSNVSGQGYDMLNSRRADDRLYASFYKSLHETRLLINHAIPIIEEYGVTTPKSYIAELHALKGYIYLYFAESYCSGVPFSEAVPEGNVILSGPVSTEEMLMRARAEFDTALSLSGDSIRIKRLALVGKARAYMNSNQYALAASFVKVDSVPRDFSYNMSFATGANAERSYMAAWHTSFMIGNFEIGNRLGENGLDYMTAGQSSVVNGVPIAGDPRVPSLPVSQFGSQFIVPSRYLDGHPIPVASGVEARLIEAEVLLKSGAIQDWANILNDLRQNAITPAIPALPTDSTTLATPEMRINVQFREKAFWLYGTGHRIGDMRRLIRQYERNPEQVFPTGVQNAWSAPFNTYGPAVNLVPPSSEVQYNPNYKSCLNRDA